MRYGIDRCHDQRKGQQTLNLEAILKGAWNTKSKSHKSIGIMFLSN